MSPGCKKIVGALAVLGALSNPAILRAAGDIVCIDNQFEVAWVHPGVTFFLEKEEGTCAGEHITLQEGETGCFETYPVPYDGSWYLSALDGYHSRMPDGMRSPNLTNSNSV